MAKVVQGTASPGFGGLEMVIIEFHEWLISQNIEAYVLTIQDSPLERTLIHRGYRNSTISIPKENPQLMKFERQSLDSPDTAMLFHRQQGLKQLRFKSPQSKISAISHTFYGVKKKDFWHRMVFSKVDQWIVLTEKHKANLLETTPINENRVKIIPNGVNLQKYTARFKPLPSPTSTLEIGVIARLDRQKGQDIALRALEKLIKESEQKYHLHFFGEDTPSEAPVRPSLEKLAKNLGIADFVFFDGFQEDLHQKIHSLDIIWMPSHKETFGRCIIEGMAAGVPVIASNAGGVSDIITHEKNGLLFETKNPQDLAEKTQRLLQRPELFASIQRQARLDAELRYDQNKIWLQLLQAILPNSALPVHCPDRRRVDPPAPEGLL